LDRYGTLQLFTISAISCPVMFLSFLEGEQIVFSTSVDVYRRSPESGGV